MKGKKTKGKRRITHREAADLVAADVLTEGGFLDAVSSDYDLLRDAYHATVRLAIHLKEEMRLRDIIRKEMKAMGFKEGNG